MTTLNVRQMLRDMYGSEIVDRDPSDPNVVTVRDIAATEERAQGVGEQLGKVGMALGNQIMPFLGGLAGQGIAEEVGKAATKAVASVERKIDLTKMMEDVAQQYNLDPAQTRLQLSDENNPLETPALNFVQRVNYSGTRTENDKKSYLAKEFGAENVKKGKDGMFLVKQGDDWYKADSSFTSDLLAESPTIAGGVAGASIGASAGTAVLPGKGTLIGGAIGAGIGSALGKLGSLKAAEQAGLRTEDDAAQVAKEVGKEFLFGMAGEVAVPVAKLTGKALSNSMSRAYGKIAKDATTDGARYAAAEALSKMTGVDVVDNLVYLDKPDVVLKHQNKVVDWLERGRITGEANPVEMEMGNIVQDTLTKAKDFTQAQYGRQAERIGSLTKDLKINVASFLDQTTAEIKGLGLVDDAGAWSKATEREIAKIVDPKSVNKIRQVYNLINNAGKKGGEVTFKDAHTLINNMDEVLEAAGAYARGQGEVGITTPAVAQIKKIRAGLKDTIVQNLQSKNPVAADAYLAMNKEFSQNRAFLDELMPMSSDERVQTLVSKLADGRAASGPQKEAFRGLAKKMGLNADSLMSELLTRRAAINTSALTRQGQSGVGALASAATGTSSPRVTSKFTAEKFAALKAQAAASEFVRGLSPTGRAQLISKPEYMRAIEQSITQALQGGEQVKQQLLAPLQGGNQGGNEGM